MLTPLRQTCCDTVWTVTLGLPLPWTTGNGDTEAQAMHQAWTGPWDPISATANVLFWAYAAAILTQALSHILRPTPLPTATAAD
ncbi:hypothetical protein GCM10009828_098100 [Actinoplanes couchii]|uniref:Uncharacterized protein n=2 Tax=Actinoplanes couchii TaxID=403638 RepID=A0ABQ3XQH1_9ACTN|nr:hypothetical protein Aco03nite_091680 [Actinoplanes couchii]